MINIEGISNIKACLQNEIHGTSREIKAQKSLQREKVAADAGRY